MSDATHTYHERTKHTPRSLLEGGRLLDWDNQPLPLKIYPAIDPIPLPGAWDEPGMTMAAALSGEVAPQQREIQMDRLARLLFLSAGVTRRQGTGEHTILFRAAPSAGALYPIELYVVCGELPDLPAGLYHFEPAEFVLRRLRRGDLRGHLASAAADPTICSRPVSLLVTGIPWRTTWKYGARGYRHLFWDAGTILANTIVAAASDGLAARVLVGFVDNEVSHLLGVDTPSHPFEERPLAVVTLGREEPGEGRPQQSPRTLPPLEEQVVPLSAHVREELDVWPVHTSGTLTEADGVEEWRTRLDGIPQRQDARHVRVPEDATLTVEEVVLRRGSTRLFSREAVPERALTWGMAVAAGAVPGDFAARGSLLTHYLSVHAVEGIAPGAYLWDGGRLDLLRPGDFRDEATRLCLDQPLAGDSAFTVFHSAPLDTALSLGGARAYRAAQLEGGIVAGRLQLAAFTLACGGTGLTFLDDEVRAFFETPAEPMTTTAIGVPGYRARPGRLPSEQPPIRLQR